MSNIQIGDEGFAALLRTAIFEALTPEKKDELLSKALKDLFTKKDYGKTELERIIYSVVHEVVRETVAEYVKQPHISAELHSLVTASISDALLTPARRKSLSDEIASAFARALTSRGD